MILKIIDNRNFILTMAFLCGIIFSNLANLFQTISLPALMLVMMASSLQIDLSEFSNPIQILVYTSRAFIFHYLLLPLSILTFAWFLAPAEELWMGFILIAAAPPGLAIIPFAHITGGAVNLAYAATFTLYLLSLAVFPLMVFLLSGEATVSPMQVFIIMIQLVVLPFILGQIIRKSKLANFIEKQKSRITNWGFFIVTYAVVGLNRDVFLGNLDSLVRIFVVVLLSTFFMRLVISGLSKHFNLPSAETKSYQLLGTIKNGGLAAGIALNYYNDAVSVPSAVLSVFYILYFIYLGVIAGKRTAMRWPLSLRK